MEQTAEFNLPASPSPAAPVPVEHTVSPPGAGAPTPMEMLNRAVASGASIDVLEKLMALQERYEANNARRAFDAAIAAAKSEIKPVVRNRTGHNSKRYADFSAIACAVDPILSRHGLSYRFKSRQDANIYVTCVLCHRDGHSEETTLGGPADNSGNKNAIQAIGSTLTYLQRYSLMQALGLAASDDDDGKSAGAVTGPISDDQADELRKLIDGIGNVDVPKFLQYVGAESVADIPAAKFEAAKKALNERRKRVAS